MLPQVRERLATSIDYHQLLVDYHASHLEEHEKAAYEARKAATQPSPQEDRTLSEEEHGLPHEMHEGEDRPEGDGQEERSQEPKRPSSPAMVLVDLHSDAQRQLRELLESQPVSAEIVRVRQEHEKRGIVRRIFGR